MTAVTATQLRGHLFDFLQKVQKGESLVIKLNGQEIGKIIPMPSQNWRQKVTNKPVLLQSASKTFAPLKSTWRRYL